MKETADEWLRPLNIQRKDREKRKRDRERRFAEPDESLEALLPPKAETDLLVNLYLDQFEQIHRIVHLPSFKREYSRFWDPSRTRNAAFTALVLAMLAISNCIDGQETKFVGVKSSAFQTAEKWVKACDEWLNRQSHKHRRLVHYQTMCLLYLAKRVNVIKKKRFWTSSNSLVGEGIIVGLHRDPEQMSTAITPYYSEMRRRLWATIIEFDIQSSYDQGLPTMLSQLPIETRAPRNINDEDFDEDSEELPPSKDFDRYTTASYQHASRQSLQLRLELNQILTGPIATLDWEQVTRYRDMILQEIDALPHWGPDDLNDAGVLRKPILGYTLLRLQLKQYLVPLHQSFLKLAQSNSKYQLAEFVYYNAARDVVLMHDNLFKKGIRALYFLREDTMNAAVNLCHVSLLQPKGKSPPLLPPTPPPPPLQPPGGQFPLAIATPMLTTGTSFHQLNLLQCSRDPAAHAEMSRNEDGPHSSVREQRPLGLFIDAGGHRTVGSPLGSDTARESKGPSCRTVHHVAP